MARGKIYCWGWGRGGSFSLSLSLFFPSFEVWGFKEGGGGLEGVDGGEGSIAHDILAMHWYEDDALTDIFPVRNRSMMFVEGDCNMSKFQGKDGQPVKALNIVQSELLSPLISSHLISSLLLLPLPPPPPPFYLFAKQCNAMQHFDRVSYNMLTCDPSFPFLLEHFEILDRREPGIEGQAESEGVES